MTHLKYYCCIKANVTNYYEVMLNSIQSESKPKQKQMHPNFKVGAVRLN